VARHSVPKTDESTERHRQLLAAFHLPHTEMIKFDGNPLQYWSFIRSFENSIQRICDDDGSRLTPLLQYCVGKVSNVIHCCTVMPSREGYKHAHKLLNERFGNKYRISESWIEWAADRTPRK